MGGFIRHIPAIFKSPRLKTWLWVFGMTAACVPAHTVTAHAFGLTECAASRYGSDLTCTAGDVSITGMRVIGDTTSCIGGTNIILDLEITVNFAVPNRWDIGIFISNDGNDPKLLPASGGAASCSVDVLPPASPFLDLDPGPWGGVTDTCGDGNKDIGGGTGSGIHYMANVTVPCQALPGSGGDLYIPFVVSWDNQSSPVGDTCTSSADPVPNTKSKCNSPTIAQGTVSVVVMPTLTKTDGITFISPGAATDYEVVITNTTGDSLSGAVFKDPAVTDITVNSVFCTPSGGASCPVTTVADMQGAGITVPSMPVDSSVTFTINATLDGDPPETRTNTATVTVGGETATADDTDTLVGVIAINPSSSSGSGSPGTLMVYDYTLYNFGGSSDTISLSALSSQGWTVSLSDSSITVPAGGSESFTVTVQIPPGAAVGTLDTTTITAVSGNDPVNTTAATANTTVDDPLTLTPDNTGSGGKGSSAYYDHRVQNNTASSQSVIFSTVLTGSCAGWTAGVYKSDRVSQIPPATVTLAPFGGYEDIVVRVDIPSGAATGSTCTVTTTALAGGYSDSATDVTTVKDLILYSDPGYTDEDYIYPAGNPVYAQAFGLMDGTAYQFLWYDPNDVLVRTSPDTSATGTIAPDTYDIPVAGPLGTWRVEVVRVSDGLLFAETEFYVGPDHVNADYSGTNPAVDKTATVDLSLHDRYNHVVPFDSLGVLVAGNPPTTKDPLKITVTVDGSASIVSTTLTGAVIVGQTVTGYLLNTGDPATDGTATITITDSVEETVNVTPESYNSALYGSPVRDEPTTVQFVLQQVRIFDWREVK